MNTHPTETHRDFPPDWKRTRVLDVIAEYFSGPSPTCEERNISGEHEWGVLKTTAATKEAGWNWRAHKTLPKTFWNKANLELRAGDVIVTKAGPRHRVGVTAWIDYVPQRIIPSGKMIALRPNKARVLPLMLAAAIDSKAAQKFLDHRTTGMAESQVNFENEALLLAPIAIPPLPEQQAIAQALSDVDDLIQSLERLIAKKRDLKQAAMQQLLTGQTRLPEFNGEWETTQVRCVIDQYFSGPSPTCEERNISGESEWGVLKTTAATKDHGWDWRAHKTLPPGFWNKPHLELREGDVIVTKAGPRHRVGVTAWIDYVPERIIPSGKMIALRPNRDRVVPLMLAAAVASKESHNFLNDRTTGMAESQVNFENDALLQAPIAIPSMAEQTAIAEVLSDMDSEIAALEARLGKTRDLKQGMMQELLTGRTRLV